MSRVLFGTGVTPTSFSRSCAPPRRTMPKKMSPGSGPWNVISKPSRLR